MSPLQKTNPVDCPKFGEAAKREVDVIHDDEWTVFCVSGNALPPPTWHQLWYVFLLYQASFQSYNLPMQQ